MSPRERPGAKTPGKKGPRFAWPEDAQFAADVRARRIRWLDGQDEKIPTGMITLVAGRPGQGKSMWSAWLAAEVSRRGHSVIFSNLEDLRAEVTRPRLEAAKADLGRITFWKPDLDSAVGLLQLETFIKALDVKLLVIDPIAAHIRASIYNDQLIRQALNPLSDLLERTDCAAVILAHTTKGGLGKHGHPLDCIGGSGGGLAGAARVVYVFGPNPDDEDERVLATAKENIMKPVSMSFEIDEADVSVEDGSAVTPHMRLLNEKAEVNARQVLQWSGEEDTETGTRAVKRAIAAEWLTSYLMFGGRPASEVKEDATGVAGLAWKTTQRAAKELGVVKARHGFGEGSHIEWSLPDGHPALKVADLAGDLLDNLGGSFKPGQLTVEDVLALIDGKPEEELDDE